MVTLLGHEMGQAHLEGNSLSRRAPQDTEERLALRTRGRLSVCPSTGRNFQLAPGFLNQTRTLMKVCMCSVCPKLPSEQRSPALGTRPALWAPWPWARSGAEGS